MQPSGRNKKQSRMHRKACSSLRFRHLRIIGGQKYDWRKVEAKLKALPQFMTEMMGRTFRPLRGVSRFRLR